MRILSFRVRGKPGRVGGADAAVWNEAPENREPLAGRLFGMRVDDGPVVRQGDPVRQRRGAGRSRPNNPNEDA